MWFGGLLDAAFILQCINHPTEPFIDLEPLNQRIDIFEAHIILRSADFKALKLRNILSGEMEIMKQEEEEEEVSQ